MPIEIKAVSGGEQLQRWIAVHNEVRPDDPQTVGAKALIRAEESDHLDLLAYVDELPVGAALLAGNPEGEGSERVWIQVEVLPAYRGRGVGTALLRAVSEHARRRGHTTLACHSLADDADSLAFLERRGFVPHRRWNEFVLELPSSPAHVPPPPDGVEIISLAKREPAHRDVRGRVGDLPRAGWAYATPNALVREVAGTEWRRRGVASALLAAQIEGARAQGLRRLCTWIPDDDPADLYTKLGFECRLRFVIVDGPLL